jgi:hypothetical protein
MGTNSSKSWHAWAMEHNQLRILDCGLQNKAPDEQRM